MGGSHSHEAIRLSDYESESEYEEPEETIEETLQSDLGAYTLGSETQTRFSVDDVGAKFQALKLKYSSKASISSTLILVAKLRFFMVLKPRDEVL